jgi:hypothetical protein
MDSITELYHEGPHLEASFVKRSDVYHYEPDNRINFHEVKNDNINQHKYVNSVSGFHSDLYSSKASKKSYASNRKSRV